MSEINLEMETIDGIDYYFIIIYFYDERYYAARYGWTKNIKNHVLCWIDYKRAAENYSKFVKLYNNKNVKKMGGNDK